MPGKVENFLYSESVFHYEKPLQEKFNKAKVRELLLEVSGEFMGRRVDSEQQNLSPFSYLQFIPKRQLPKTNHHDLDHKISSSHVNKELEEAHDRLLEFVKSISYQNFSSFEGTINALESLNIHMNDYKEALIIAENICSGPRPSSILQDDYKVIAKDKEGCEIIISLLTCLKTSLEVIEGKKTDYNPEEIREIQAAGDKLGQFLSIIDKQIGKKKESSPLEKFFIEKIKPLEDILSSLKLLEDMQGRNLAEYIKGKVFELKPQFLANYLHLIKAWQDEADKDGLLKAYKDIFFANKSLSKLTVIICQEMVNLKLYKDALELLTLLEKSSNKDSQANREEMIEDLEILKAFCQVGVGDFKGAKDTLVNMPSYVLEASNLRMLQIEIYDHLGDNIKVKAICEDLAGDITICCSRGDKKSLEEILGFLNTNEETKNEVKAHLESESGEFLGANFTVQNGNIEMLKLLFKHFPLEVRDHSASILYHAIMYDHHECIEFLKNNGANPEELKGTIAYSYYLDYKAQQDTLDENHNHEMGILGVAEGLGAQ